MDIKVSTVREKPTDIPEVKRDDPVCNEDTDSTKNNTLFRKFNCDVHFTGNTNGSGQVVIFESGSFIDVIKKDSEYTLVTVMDEGAPIANALLDGSIRYVQQSTGVDTGSTYILSANIHARTMDRSKETTLNWP